VRVGENACLGGGGLSRMEESTGGGCNGGCNGGYNGECNGQWEGSEPSLVKFRDTNRRGF
jgi:hypothetical protein